LEDARKIRQQTGWSLKHGKNMGNKNWMLLDTIQKPNTVETTSQRHGDSQNIHIDLFLISY
jgi:hypothetical protein